MRRHLQLLLTQAKFLVPIVAILLTMVPLPQTTPVAEARVNASSGFASAVACLNNPDQFATTQFANTIVSPVSGTSSIPAVLSLSDSGTGGAFATLGNVGSVYGVAYDTGGDSGRERMFVSAYTKRFVNYGPAGPGGVYVFEKINGVWTSQGSFVAANLTPPAVRSGRDTAIKPFVGRSSLGGMQVSPDGTELYVMNVQQKQIEVFNLTAPGLPTRVGTIPVNLGLISGGNASVQADLWPFALKFFPHKDGNGNPLLLIGVTDAASRGINPVDGKPFMTNAGAGVFTTPPRAHLLLYNTVSRTWGLSLSQDLGNDVTMSNRALGETQWGVAERWDYLVKGWNHWRENYLAAEAQTVVHPQPMLTDIEFVSENKPAGSPAWAWPVMVLGFRDRTSDILFNGNNIPTGEQTTTGHGDTVAYRLSGGAWVPQTVNRQNNTQLTGAPVMRLASAYDFYNDDLHSFPGNTPAHVENHAGGLTTVLSTNTNVNGFGVKLATTTLLGGGGGQGVYMYDNRGASGGDPNIATTVIPVNATVNRTKSANLGDLEVLCSYALIGGRVWNDADNNGIQNGEAGVAGIALQMRRTSDNAVLSTLTTDSQGQYLFAVPPNMSFRVQVDRVASGAAMSTYRIGRQRAAGSGATNDSDAFQLGGYIQFRGPTVGVQAGELRAPTRNMDERSYDIALTRALPDGYVGDRVWIDANGNGVQDAGEVNANAAALNGATVTLRALSTEPGVVDRTATISGGTYGFNNVVPGTYQLIFPAPLTGYRVSPQDQGGNDTLDSDPNNAYTTASFNVLAGSRLDMWDYGVIGGADLWVIKNVSTATAQVGTQFTYTLTYGNRTGVALNAVINDTLPAGMLFVSSSPGVSTRSGQALTWNLGQLNAGQTGSIQITVQAPMTVTPSTAYQQVIQNCASILSASSELNAADNSSCVNTTIQRPEVTITKSAPSSAVIGTQFTYSLTYRNIGMAPAAGVIVADPLPTGLTFVAFTANPAPACSYQSAMRRIYCDVGTLNAGVSRTVSFTVQSDFAFTGTSLSNTATIGGPSGAPIPGDDPSNNTSTTTTAILRPDVRIVKTAPTTVVVGDTFTYSLTYSNAGTAPANSVEVSDVLPAGLTFVAFTANPAPACTYTASSRTVSCNVGTLNNGISRTVSFTARADVTMTGTTLTNTARIGGPGGTPIPGENTPGDNTSTTTTTVQFPNPGIGITISPKPFPLGDPGTITLTYRNTGTGVARSTRIVTTIPVSIPMGTLPSGCVTTLNNSTIREITCSLGDVNPGATGTRVLPVSLPGSYTFGLDQINVSTVISTTTPERTADQADNTASDTALVVRPNVFVTATGPDAVARVAWGSAFYYDIGYGNIYRARPTQTRAAQNSVLRVTLPSDVTFLTASVAPTSISGQVLTWNLNTLSPQQTGSLRVAVKTNAPAGTTLTMLAQISTTTAGDDPNDNQATVVTTVVPPPASIPDPTSEMRLAIRSTLDPNTNDASPTNGVYVSSGPNISWPAGEVLDFTPRLTSYSLEDPGWPFEHRVRLVGWSIQSFEVNGRTIDPRSADARGIANCRPGASPSIAPTAMSGCAYAYVGASTTGRLPSAFLPTAALLESDLNNQAHAYWTQPPTPPMRNDVYLYTVDPLEPVKMTLSIEVEAWVVNSCPNFLLDPMAPCTGTEEEMPVPGRTRQVVTETFTVTLLVPRSVVGPGNTSDNGSTQP